MFFVICLHSVIRRLVSSLSTDGTLQIITQRAKAVHTHVLPFETADRYVL